MNDKDLQTSATPEARNRLRYLLEHCPVEGMDCLHISFADSGEVRDPDGQIKEILGPHWDVGWNTTNDVGSLPFWVSRGEFSLFFPQRELYEEVSGNILHFEDGDWSFIDR